MTENTTKYPGAVVTIEQHDTGFFAELTAGAPYFPSVNAEANFGFSDHAHDIADTFAVGEHAEGSGGETYAYCERLVANLNLEDVAAAFRSAGFGTVTVI